VNLRRVLKFSFPMHYISVHYLTMDYLHLFVFDLTVRPLPNPGFLHFSRQYKIVKIYYTPVSHAGILLLLIGLSQVSVSVQLTTIIHVGNLEMYVG